MQDLVSKGKDLEKIVLSRAVQKHKMCIRDRNKALQRLTMLTELSGISLPELLTESVSEETNANAVSYTHLSNACISEQ